MRVTFALFIVIICGLGLYSCESASAEKCFDIAVLNCNMMHGFAGGGFERELESPTVAMIDGDKDHFAPLKRTQIIQNKIDFIEPAFARVRQLNTNDDNREMIEASLALYDYVLPVYKNEYMQLARMYDEDAPRAEIDTYMQSIADRYYEGYEERLRKLETAGKPYAARHHIQVAWDRY